MTCDAGSSWPRVIFAEPVAQPPSVRHSARSFGPAARWIAPSTPPPPRSDVFAALTIASTASVVMSATVTSSRAGPTSAEMSGVVMASIQQSMFPKGGNRFSDKIMLK